MTKQEDNTMKTLVYLTVIQVILVLVIAFQVNTIAGALDNGVPAIEQPGAPSEPAKADVGTDDDAVRGEEDAPVTIIEFSDFQCPFCERFYSQTLPQLEEEYISTGKVKLVYRDFPLSFHQEAQPAAEAAECAGEQGKYWEMHDKIFENQASLSNANYKKWAIDIGLNTAKFNTCLDSGAMASEVQKDFTDGQASGVQGTPAFFVNGKLVSGARIRCVCIFPDI